MRQEVNLLSERQDIFRGMVGDKIRMQSGATEKYYEQIFEEMESWKKRNQNTCAGKVRFMKISERKR